MSLVSFFWIKKLIQNHFYHKKIPEESENIKKAYEEISYWLGTILGKLTLEVDKWTVFCLSDISMKPRQILASLKICINSAVLNN